MHRKISQRVDQFVCTRMMRNLIHPETPEQEELKKFNEARVHRITRALESSWQQIRTHPDYQEPDQPDEFMNWDTWEEDQEALWKDAQSKVKDRFVSLLAGSSTSLVEMALYIDSYADMATMLAKQAEGVREANRELDREGNMEM